MPYTNAGDVPLSVAVMLATDNYDKSDDAIYSQLDKIDAIKRVDDSYSYLLNIPCSQLTKEKYQKLKEQIKEDKTKLQEAKKMTVEELWNHDLDELLKVLK